MEFDIKDKTQKKQGKQRIQWALARMPVLEIIRKRFTQKKSLKNIRIGACLHLTTETAALAITLKKAGANLRLCASNPLSTQDDVAASLVFDYKIPVFAINNENRKTYYQHIESVLANKPQITLDDGADLVSTIHKKHAASKRVSLPWGSTEETTTGVIRLRSLAKSKKLLYPVVAVNDAYTKHLFDNRYGTGQSTLDGITRATNKLVAGSKVVVCGYGWCGKGFASRAKGAGAKVIVAETNSLRALEAVMDGFEVMPLKQAARVGDIFVTLTGDVSVLRKEHFQVMKDKALIANAGHFDVEIDIAALSKLSKRKKRVKHLVDEYRLKNNKSIYLLGEGRLVNLACAEGHPAEVMDLSFANQALSCQYIADNHYKLTNRVYTVPQAIDYRVAKLKLTAMGVKIDKLTPRQKQYLASWQEGT